MLESDNDQIKTRLVACKQTYTDIDPYILWVYSVDCLLNEQGIYGYENEGARLH
jgi:hypothetical protein